MLFLLVLAPLIERIELGSYTSNPWKLQASVITRIKHGVRFYENLSGNDGGVSKLVFTRGQQTRCLGDLQEL